MQRDGLALRFDNGHIWNRPDTKVKVASTSHQGSGYTIWGYTQMEGQTKCTYVSAVHLTEEDLELLTSHNTIGYKIGMYQRSYETAGSRLKRRLRCLIE